MSRARVLVVDDNEHNREYARQVLMDGWAIEIAEDGVVALERIEAAPPDLVVLDLSMPRLDGWGVIRALKAQPSTRAIPVIACSAHAMAGDRERALAAGFEAYVAKPYRADELTSCVERFLGPGSPDPEASDDDDWGDGDWSLSDDDWDEESS